MSITYHSAFLLNDGTVKTCGWNEYGQLGGETSKYGFIPKTVPSVGGIKQVSCGHEYTMFLLADGTIKACGSNSDSQFGDGTYVGSKIPVMINGVGDVKQIICGGYHTIFLMKDGTVKTCGKNVHGQLGNANNATKFPTSILGLENVEQVACGQEHTVFVLKDGTVKACGFNQYYQLGDGSNINKDVPVQINGLNNVKQAACGVYHTMFLMEDGTVKGCGLNDCGQIGDGTRENKTLPILLPGVSGVKEISCGWETTLFLMNDGTVKACGRSSYGELADLAIIGGSVITPTTIASLKGKVAQVFSGWNHSLFLMEDGTVMGCGNNGMGQFGSVNTDSTGGVMKVLTLINDLSNVVALPDHLLPDTNSSNINLVVIPGDSKVTLSWTAVTGATNYNVKRSTTAGGPYTTIAEKVTGTTYVDTSVTNGTTYYYVVTAVTADGESPNSNEASATPKAGSVTPPITPPITTGNALLRVTMIDSSEREYRLSSAEVDGFVNWYTRTIGTGISCYALNDIVDNSKEYLSFEKIISFKVVSLTK